MITGLGCPKMRATLLAPFEGSRMEIIFLEHDRVIKENGTLPFSSSVAIGNFDGLHRGHCQLIRTAKQFAKDHGLAAGVVTFHPHPKIITAKETSSASLTPLHVKLKLLEAMGIDFVVILHFNRELASLPPDRFIEEYIMKLQFHNVVVGFDFCFGTQGKGTVHTLMQTSTQTGDFQVSVIPPIHDDRLKISSSRIKGILEEGDVEEAGILLGRHYFVEGYAKSSEEFRIDQRFITPAAGKYNVVICLQHVKSQAIVSVSCGGIVCLERGLGDIPAESIWKAGEKGGIHFVSQAI